MKPTTILCCALAVTTFACERGTKATEYRRAWGDVRTMQPAADKYRTDHPTEACPTIEKLRAEKELSASSKATDPWGTTYLVKCAGEAVIVSSAGPDRTFDTTDDITSPAAQP